MLTLKQPSASVKPDMNQGEIGWILFCSTVEYPKVCCEKIEDKPVIYLFPLLLTEEIKE